MHIENLKVFCDLVESQSFSRAAKLNNITQSAVSQQLRSIEDQLHCTIVDRSQKQFRLTTEGDLFYRASKDVLRRMDQLRADIQGVQNVISGSLHVVTVNSIGLHELPPFLKKFLHAYPLVNLRLEYRRSPQVYDEVEQNIADIGLVAFPQKSRQVEIVDFLEDRLVVICAPTHPLASQKAITLKDISEYKLIGFEIDNPSRKAIDHFLREAKVDIEPALSFDNIETMKRAVEVDAGIALIPSSTIAQEVKLGTLVAIEIKGKPLVRPLGIIYRKGRILYPAMKSFIATLTGK
jgi:DNA-binding transcriptional LysR family regulator